MATTFECPCCDMTVRFQRSGSHIDLHKKNIFADETNIGALKHSIAKQLPYTDIRLTGNKSDVNMRICFCCGVAYKIHNAIDNFKHKTWMLKHTEANPDHAETHLQKCKALMDEYNASYNNKVETVEDKEVYYQNIIKHKDDEIAMLKKEMEMMKKQMNNGKPVSATKVNDKSSDRLKAKDDAISALCDVLDNHYGHTSHSEYYRFVLSQTLRFHVKQEISEETYDERLEEISDVAYFKTYLPGGENDPALD
jgi:hypothetical protein